MSRSPFFLARRILARTARYIIHDRLLLLLVTAIASLAIVLGPGGLLKQAPSISTPADDAAEQYMRGLRDKDVAELLGSLSPEMRRSLEQRFGRLGVAAVAALFNEQEQRGERIIGYRLVGKYETVQHESVRFYVVQAQRGNERRDVPYTLTIGPDGKVTRVE